MDAAQRLGCMFRVWYFVQYAAPGKPVAPVRRPAGCMLHPSRHRECGTVVCAALCTLSCVAQRRAPSGRVFLTLIPLVYLSCAMVATRPRAHAMRYYFADPRSRVLSKLPLHPDCILRPSLSHVSAEALPNYP